MLAREKYEKQLKKLSKQAGYEVKEVDKLTDIELITQINNWLTYFGQKPFSHDEIERILNATK